MPIYSTMYVKVSSLYEEKPFLFGETLLFCGLVLLAPCYALVNEVGHKIVIKKLLKASLSKFWKQSFEDN